MAKGKQKRIKRAKVTGDKYRELSLAYAANNAPAAKIVPKEDRIRKECKRQASAEKLAFAEQMRRHMTAAEAHLWQVLRKTGLFDAQPVIYGYIPDFCCFRYKLIIEVDGAIHDTRRHYDSERDHHLRVRGYRVLRFSNDDIIRDRQSVVGQIMEQL